MKSPGREAGPQREGRPIAEKDSVRINERIRAREIMLIASDGEQLGVMTPDEARARAVEEGYDLVEVAPNARPPVCRIMDFGKYKYEQKKKLQASKKNQHPAPGPSYTPP